MSDSLTIVLGPWPKPKHLHWSRSQVLRAPHSPAKKEQVSGGKGDLRSSWEARAIRENFSEELALKGVTISSFHAKGLGPWQGET